METVKCPICGSKNTSRSSPSEPFGAPFYACPVCGRYEIDFRKNNFNKNHLASYLALNSFRENDYSEYRYHTTRTKEFCDKYSTEFKTGNNIQGWPIHIDPGTVENWFPKKFSDRIDLALLYINAQVKHIGQKVMFSFPELLSVFFIDRYEQDASGYYDKKWNERDRASCYDELSYIVDYLQKSSYINYEEISDDDQWANISLTPEGYARVDELQKHTETGVNVLVAMKFGDETIPLREAIRQGISNAGYNAVFIDEVQHNNLITPELLSHIRDSRFVVVDLTHQNNGAYFEEGYAMGLGKPVIQLCKEGTKLHFDIAQINTIMWKDEADITERLTNRIKATID